MSSIRVNPYPLPDLLAALAYAAQRGRVEARVADLIVQANIVGAQRSVCGRRVAPRAGLVMKNRSTSFQRGIVLFPKLAYARRRR